MTKTRRKQETSISRTRPLNRVVSRRDERRRDGDRREEESASCACRRRGARRARQRERGGVGGHRVATLRVARLLVVVEGLLERRWQVVVVARVVSHQDLSVRLVALRL